MKYNSIGEQLIAKAQELDPNYKPDKFNDMSEAIDVILNNTGGGDEYIEIVLDFEQFAAIRDQNTWDLRIPANTITEDMLSPILEGKKKGLLLKIKIEEEEGMNGFYTTIPFYCDFATGMLFTNVTKIFGLTGSWVGSIDKIDQDQVCKFNSLEGRVFYHPNIKDGKISQEEYDFISSLVKDDKLAGITVDIAEIATFTFPLMGINYGNTFVFGLTTVSTETDVYTKKSIDYITYTIKPDLSCKLDWNTNYFIGISSGINERVIPTITQGHQENLTIGNGLEIKNGALQAIGSGGGPLLDMFPYCRTDNQTHTITQEGFDLLTQKLTNHEIVGISLGDPGICMLLNDIASDGISFIGPYDGDHGRYKATFKHDLSVKTEYVDKGGSSISLTLPRTAPSSQVIPSITTTNTQQNLTIGDGLVVENGILKTNNIPDLPSDASTKTYVLKSVNGVLTWSE